MNIEGIVTPEVIETYHAVSDARWTKYLFDDPRRLRDLDTPTASPR